MLFKSLEAGLGPQIAAVPLILCIIISLFVALFRNSEMTFLPFILNVLRLNLNTNVRVWSKGTDSFSNLEIGWVTSHANIKAKTEMK